MFSFFGTQFDFISFQILTFINPFSLDLFYLITGPVPLTVPVPDQQPFSVGNVLVQMPHVCSVSFHNLTCLFFKMKKPIMLF